MWRAAVPWKVDKNKIALYFDSHQVALILDGQKFTRWPGHCQSTGFNESHSHRGLTQCRQKLVLPAGGEGQYRYFRLDTCTKPLSLVLTSWCYQVHMMTDTITMISEVWNWKCTFSSDSAILPNNPCLFTSINFSYLVSCLSKAVFKQTIGGCADV